MLTHTTCRFIAAIAWTALAAASAWAEGPRILLIGDSWAAGVEQSGVFNDVLEAAGLGADRVRGETTAVSGSQARDWSKPRGRLMKNPGNDQPTGLEVIATALDDHPTIDLVHLIIGGNDVLEAIGHRVPGDKGWAARLARIEADLETLVAYLLARPQIRQVLLADYTYINPAHARAVFGCLDSGDEAWSFGGASQEEVAGRFLAAAEIKRAVAARHPGCHYLPHFGRLQHRFNQPEGAPSPGPPPDFDPFPGGDPAQPPPDDAFDPIQLGACPPDGPAPGDGIHINQSAHKLLLEVAVEHFYRAWLEE